MAYKIIFIVISIIAALYISDNYHISGGFRYIFIGLVALISSLIVRIGQ